jgi:uncharacterized protein DUF72
MAQREKYQENYNNSLLGNWEDRIKGWAAHLSHICLYFNNDQHGYAVNNALTLQHLLNREGVEPGRLEVQLKLLSNKMYEIALQQHVFRITGSDGSPVSLLLFMLPARLKQP